VGYEKGFLEVGNSVGNGSWRLLDREHKNGGQQFDWKYANGSDEGVERGEHVSLVLPQFDKGSDLRVDRGNLGLGFFDELFDFGSRAPAGSVGLWVWQS
jgi:hypothetical protein